ncbi:MAG: mechanosensitive ion channel [bacterium]|nr:mechanosensitive ion channel [bacterium]
METSSALDSVMQILYTFATNYGIKILGAIIILIVGRMAASLIRKAVAKALKRSNLDDNLIRFFSKLTYIAVMAFAVLACLEKFGVETTSFVAVLGAAGFAIGFALQGSLSHFAAGVMLLVFKPFKTGDFVEVNGVGATVEAIMLFNTLLNTPDNVHIIVPNGAIFGNTIKNYSHNPTRRVDIAVGIGYGCDIDKACAAIETEIKQDDRVLAEPTPQIVITELADSSINLSARYWVNAADYWDSKSDQTGLIKERLDAENIEIPFPQRVVYINKNDS